MGYHRAGFEVVGIDNRRQPRYPFHFIQSDALDYLSEYGSEYDFIHASPPCQAYCKLKNMWNSKSHPDLVDKTRHLLRLSGRPWIIENVVGAPLMNAFMLCGTMFRLGTETAELRRHRLFEPSGDWASFLVPECRHTRRVIGVYGHLGRDLRRPDLGPQSFGLTDRGTAMGIDWMKWDELNQAIPPAYTEFIGRHAISYLNRKAELWTTSTGR